MSELNFGLAALLHDLEKNLRSFPLSFVFGKAEVVIGHKPRDALVGNEFDDYHRAFVDILLVISEVDVEKLTTN